MPFNRTAVYRRISEDRESLELGVQRQEEDLRAAAAERGWTVTGDYLDNDVSASTRSRKVRPAFEQMMAAAERGEHDAIAFYTTSRLTRRPLEYERLINLVERHGVQLVSLRSGVVDLTTADGRMVARILAAADAAEAERTGERVARAFEQRRAQGKSHSNARAFGYNVDMTPRLEEAEAIRVAAQMLLAGATAGEVIATWDAAGVAPVRAERWDYSTVRVVMRKASIAGLVSFKGDIVREGTWEPILDRPTWEAVCQRLEARTKRPVGWSTRKHPLVGFLLCGREGCGTRLHCDGVSYRCAPRYGGCGRIKRNKLWLDDAVDGLVRGWIARSDLAGPVEDSGPSVAGELEKTIADLRKRFLARQVDAEDFYPMLTALRDQHRDALAAEVPRVAVGEDDLLAMWDSGDVGPQRIVLGQVFTSLVVHPVGRIGRAPIPYESLEPFFR